MSLFCNHANIQQSHSLLQPRFTRGVTPSPVQSANLEAECFPFLHLTTTTVSLGYMCMPSCIAISPFSSNIGRCHCRGLREAHLLCMRP
ncbi:uncharacterized protein MYCFIDRAFT_179161 [Pseudocercospora fijiensis CIRAD86]|uniref:Uncharacterized protein n=1 Tax=Pseudocercospora fijiensis (strain CIRAD86) TaxID=383855 RepID=M2YIS9_PSEFD|nr:uncharacterized protein MYCFIDRAFT_179161 [Pseudocercospora fijiensis CIRAD86]EME77665.1 hypothetical protein MYCFIDRAFT_179161 [Pseudocercospora fijiensis CIRAD86]